MRPKQKKYNKNEFDTCQGKVYLTNHAVSRLKQRVQLANRSERKTFVKKVFSLGISNPHRKLPKEEEFNELRSYLYHLSRRVLKKNSYCNIIWYEDVVFIVSIEKVVITILTIPEQFNDLFSKANSKT